MAKLQSILTSLGATERHQSDWSTETFICDADDARSFNLIEGLKYTVLVASKDTTTKSGKAWPKGHWSVFPAKS